MGSSVHQFCRFCAERTVPHLLMDLNSCGSLREDIQTKLSVLTSNCMIDFDLKTIPATICEPCYESLNHAFLFYNKVRESQIVLWNLLQNNSDVRSNLNPNISNPDVTAASCDLPPWSLYSGVTTSIYQNTTFQLFEETPPSFEKEPSLFCKQTISINRKESLEVSKEIQSVEKPICSNEKELKPKLEETQNIERTSSKIETGSLDCLKEDKNPAPSLKPSFEETKNVEETSSVIEEDQLDCLKEDEIFEPSLEPLFIETQKVEETLSTIKKDPLECLIEDEKPDPSFLGDNDYNCEEVNEETTEICKEGNKDVESTLCEDNHSMLIEEIPSTLDVEGTSSVCDDDEILSCNNDPYPAVNFVDINIDSTIERNINDISSVAYDPISCSWDTYKYECKFCNLKFAEVQSLREHCKESHQTCNGLKCSDCSEEFLNYNMFVVHVRTHRLELEAVCQFCNVEISDDARSHVASHGDLFCKLCGELFEEEETLKDHSATYGVCKDEGSRVHGGHEFSNDEASHSRTDVCMSCGEHFSGDISLQQHLKLASQCGTHYNTLRLRELTCSYCNKMYKDRSEFHNHVKRHVNSSELDEIVSTASSSLLTTINTKNSCESKITPMADVTNKQLTSKRQRKYFECDHCNTRYTQKSALISHMVEHNSSFPFPCVYCNIKFKNRPDIIKHIRRHESITLPKLECDHCHKLFEHKDAISKHMSIHIDRYPYNCCYCSEKFKRRSFYLAHLRAHKGMSSIYVCDYCARRFTNKPSLISHMITHNDSYPFYCKQCDRKFKRRSSYLIHLNSHDAVKPFECEVCHKRFRTKPYLKWHKNSHNVVVPLKCHHKYCYSKFRSSEGYVAHMKRHKAGKIKLQTTNNGTKYECQLCRKQFKTKCGLKAHTENQICVQNCPRLLKPNPEVKEKVSTITYARPVALLHVAQRTPSIKDLSRLRNNKKIGKNSPARIPVEQSFGRMEF